MTSSALTWLNDLAQWLGRWVPRLVLIEPTHRGVKFTWRGEAREVGCGLVLYWPMASKLVQVPVTTQSVQICSQWLPAHDPPPPLPAIPDAAYEVHARVGTVLPAVVSPSFADVIPTVLLCSVAVQFRVTRPVVAATRCLSLHALIDNRASAVVARHKQPDVVAWMREVERELAGVLEPFGAVLERVDLTSCGIGIAHKPLSDWHYADNENGQRPGAVT